MEFNHFVGIDVGKSELHVAIVATGLGIARDVHVHCNDLAGLTSLADRLGALGHPGQTLVVVENTGKYSERVVAVLYSAGYFVWLCSPAVLNHGTFGLKRRKDDPHDARQLALVARTYREQAQRYEPPMAETAHIGRLWRRRQQVIGNMVRCSNQLQSELDGIAPDPLAVRQMKAEIALFNAHVQELDNALDDALKASPKLKRMCRVMMSVPGVGKVGATKLLAITCGFTRINTAESLAAYLCTAPYPKESGTSGRKSRKVSKKGDRRTKAVLHMGVNSTATRAKGFWKQDYDRLKAQGHHHLSAINVIINRILKVLVALVQRDESFDPKKYRQNRLARINKNLQLS